MITTRTRTRSVVAMALAALVAGGAALTGAAPATAAESPATAGSLSWGIDTSYSTIFANYRNATAPAAFDGATASWPLATGDGSGYDDATGTGTLRFSGAVRIGYMIGAQQVGVSAGNYVYLESPTVTIDGDTATLSAVTAGSSHDLDPALPTTAKAERTFATIDLGAAQQSSTDDSVTWTAAPAAITDEGARVFAQFGSASDTVPEQRAVGSALDPVTITVDRELVTEDPGDGGSTPEPGDGGTTPTPGTAVSTTTVSAGPAAPVTAGTPTTVTATVTGGAASPTGSVTFTDTPAGSASPTTLGTVPVGAEGTATWTGTLGAGGHSLAAAYAGDTTYAASSGLLSGRGGAAANYGVVDVSEPTTCTTGSGATTVDDVSATWDWSTYSSEWTKTATGDDVAVDGQDFVLSNGVASVDASCATVAFTGAIRVAAYTAYFPTAGQWVELVDPTLTIAADGTGAWSAGVRSGTATDNDDAPVRTVVARVAGASLPDLSADGTLSVPLAFDGTTAAGTWDTTRTDAWSNAFVMRVPSAVRAFYHGTATATKNAEKAPSPVEVSWTGVPTEPGTDPEQPGTDPEQPGTDPALPGAGDGDASLSGNLAWGFKSSWRSYLATIAHGTTTVSDGATISGDRFVFPQAEGGDFDPATGIGTIRYSGAVDFVSAAHGFDIALRDPWIVTDASGAATLTAAVSTSDTAGLGDTARVTVADLGTGTTARTSAQLLRVAAAQNTWTDVAGTFSDTLGPDGWVQYRGQAIDPVSFGYDAAVADPGTTDPTTPVVEVPAAGGTDVQAGTVVAGTSAAAGATCTANTVSGASLTWGFKESFRNYTTGSIAKGAIALHGVSATGGGWTWSGGTGALNTAATTGRVGWTGGVEFTGHNGLMDVTLSNPTVRLSGPGTATLLADVTSTALDGGADVRLAQAAIATLDLDAGTRNGTSWQGVPATLTATGASAFSGFYSAGAALDPVSFSLPTGGATACDGTTDPELAFTGADVSGPAGVAAVLLALGIAMIVARRRRHLRDTAAVAGA